MKVLFLVITIVTFVLFYIEALIHYNYGVKSNGETQHKIIQIGNKLSVHIPSKMEGIHIAITVFIFSSITGYMSAYIIHHHLD